MKTKMTFSSSLAEVLSELVKNYGKYFKRTIGSTMVFTIFCFVGILFLVQYAQFDIAGNGKQPFSVVAYLFYRFSSFDTYCIADLSKTLFVFFVALFSIGFIRLTSENLAETELSFMHFFRKLTLKDGFVLILILIVSALLDIVLSKLDGILVVNIQNSLFVKYLSHLIFHIRLYLPLILFGLSTYSLTTLSSVRVSFKRIIFLYISVWIFNEFAYETLLWMQYHVFDLILMPLAEKPDRWFVFESFLSIPLVSFYFIGFSSAMTLSLKLTEK